MSLVFTPLTPYVVKQVMLCMPYQAILNKTIIGSSLELYVVYYESRGLREEVSSGDCIKLYVKTKRVASTSQC